MIAFEFLLVITAGIIMVVFLLVDALTYRSVTATITKTRGCTAHQVLNPSRCMFDVNYTVDGKEYKNVTLITTKVYRDANLSSLAVGKKVTVSYKTSDPTELKSLG